MVQDHHRSPVFSHVFFSGLGSCMYFPYFSGCAEVFLPNMRASPARRLWPADSRSRPWCTMRSPVAAASFVVREDRAPFTGLDVRGGDDAPSFVAARDDPVEQARPVDVEGYVAGLVQYDQVGPADVPEHRLERAVAFGLAQPGARARRSGGTARPAPCRSPSCPARSRDVSFSARSCRRTPGPVHAG